jgi:predicted alpha/beta-hydrolase family hydrolase
MACSSSESIAIPVSESQTVSGLVMAPVKPRACYVFAHGAGAGMTHSFMAAFSAGLAERSVATVRYLFPYMESGSKRPDTPVVAHAAVRAAVAEAGRRFEGLPLIAGGKSFGARMTSQAQAKDALPGVIGLAFVGFPLHPEDKPSAQRAEHLAGVRIPMLFLQGTRDELAELQHLEPMVESLRPLSTLVLFDDADHSFHVRVRSGRTDAEVMAAMLDAFVAWTSLLT